MLKKKFEIFKNKNILTFTFKKTFDKNDSDSLKIASLSLEKIFDKHGFLNRDIETNTNHSVQEIQKYNSLNYNARVINYTDSKHCVFQQIDLFLNSNENSEILDDLKNFYGEPKVTTLLKKDFLKYWKKCNNL